MSRSSDALGMVITSRQLRPMQDLRSLLHNGTLVAASVTAEEELALRAWARSSERIAVEAMRERVRSGKQRDARRLQRAYLWSLRGRLAALLEKLPRHLRDRHDCTTAERDERRVRRWAAIISALPIVGDPSVRHRPRLRLEPKASGGHRPIMSFSWRENACSYLHRQALLPFVDLHSAQYAIFAKKGAPGRDGACKALIDMMGALPAGYGMMQFDVRGFFPSINTEWLEANMELPIRTIRNLIHTGGMNVRAEGLSSALARPQLPQGSVVAPLVAEWVMADVLRELCKRLPNIRIVVYVDNIALLCRHRDASSIEQILRDVFRTHGAGPFDVHPTVYGSGAWRPLRKETSFLGYSLILRGRKAVAYLPVARQNGIRRLVTGMLSSPRSNFEKARERIKGICGAQRLWAGAATLRAELLRRVDDAERAWNDHGDSDPTDFAFALLQQVGMARPGVTLNGEVERMRRLATHPGWEDWPAIRRSGIPISGRVSRRVGSQRG